MSKPTEKSISEATDIALSIEGNTPRSIRIEKIAQALDRARAEVVSAVEKIMPTVIDPDMTAAGDKIIAAARRAAGSGE